MQPFEMILIYRRIHKLLIEQLPTEVLVVEITVIVEGQQRKEAHAKREQEGAE